MLQFTYYCSKCKMLGDYLKRDLEKYSPEIEIDCIENPKNKCKINRYFDKAPIIGLGSGKDSLGFYWKNSLSPNRKDGYIPGVELEGND